MTLFYVFALLPIVAGAILWVYDQEVNWMEWLGGSIIALLSAFCMNLIAVWGMTADNETWSGQLIIAEHHAAWKEYYEEEETRQKNIGTSKNPEYVTVHVAWIPETRWHDDEYSTASNINTSYPLNGGDYQQIRTKFGNEQAVPGIRTTSEHASRMIDGDPNDYVSQNRTGVIIPVTAIHQWTNRIKAAPSVFSYAPVGKDVPVFEYPANSNAFSSDRLLGLAHQTVDLTSFDQMNARLGPVKKVNVILVGFAGHSASIAKEQESKWIGGKKNDIVICYGYADAHPDLHTTPDWAVCFGWADKSVVKHDLADIIMASKTGVTTDTLPAIEQEVRTNWQIKDWKQFDYISVTPPTWYYVAFLAFLILSQGGFYFWAHQEQFGKSEAEEELVNQKPQERHRYSPNRY